ncbi:MAG: hypothetical protein FWE35_29025 [Streptosporangiales bacterium]|jgi:hypothetical protein|nr:hypothetical protein [Streptosporangiales bacterium]
MTSTSGIHDGLDQHDRIYLDKLRLAIDALLDAAEEPGFLNDVLQAELFLARDKVQWALLRPETAVGS